MELTASFAPFRMTPEEMNGLLIFGTHVTKNVAVLIFIAIVYGGQTDYPRDHDG